MDQNTQYRSLVDGEIINIGDEYLDGDTWVPLTTETGRFQYKFCTPLTVKQLRALGAYR